MSIKINKHKKDRILYRKQPHFKRSVRENETISIHQINLMNTNELKANLTILD